MGQPKEPQLDASRLLNTCNASPDAVLANYDIAIFSNKTPLMYTSCSFLYAAPQGERQVVRLSRSLKHDPWCGALNPNM